MPETDKQLWKHQFYHGLLPREDVNEMLQNPGDFLIRKSEETAGAKERSYVLSVKVPDKNRHFLFKEDDKGRLFVDPNKQDRFRTIARFVDHYMRHGESVCSLSPALITNPVPRQQWELDHDDIEGGKKLGSGAFGVVKLGTLRKTTPVAIKEASILACTKPQIKEFMNEARIMRRFEHLNVIKFHGAAVGQEPLMIVMELATEGALKDYLQKHTRSPRSKFFMCWGAAAGLEHIHSKNIIHCDIAARNCLFSNYKVKIADFGLAFEGTVTRLDKDKRLPIKWLAPETIRDRVCSTKTDTWAYGILCWEIFQNGNPPFADMQNTVVARKILDSSSGRLLKFPDDTPDLLVEFIHNKIWERDPKQRFSMQQVVDWFEQHGGRRSQNGDDNDPPDDKKRGDDPPDDKKRGDDPPDDKKPPPDPGNERPRRTERRSSSNTRKSEKSIRKK